MSSRPLALALVALALLPAAAQAQRDPNPCLGPQAPQLLCPDLVMRPPYDLAVDRKTRRGRTLLRAANAIDSLGLGPAELRGRRDGALTMAARQHIHRPAGSPIPVDTGARLVFKAIPGQGRYWKFQDAARFELWRIDAAGRRIKLERRGPKVAYCLRDLRRSFPGAPGSPRRYVYPSCNKRRTTRQVTLGTSVGWSDIYPFRYHEQWIDVTGLRGTYAYVHTADPRNGIYESNEDNNESETIVRLPSGQVLGAGRKGRRAPGDPYDAR